MAMSMKDLASVLVEGNKEALVVNSKRRAGKMFNQRAIALIKPKLPMMVRGYADEAIGEFVIANLIAAAIIKFGSNNEKLLMLSEAGIHAASDDLIGSLNIESVINELIDGIDTSAFTKETVAGE
jgi:hypothetical protein